MVFLHGARHCIDVGRMLFEVSSLLFVFALSSDIHQYIDTGPLLFVFVLSSDIHNIDMEPLLFMFVLSSDIHHCIDMG